MLKAGIVGLPNVGKSTLFNAITKNEVVAANYPFATIDPNVGVVLVEDERLDYLHEIYHPKKKVPTAFEFIDIAGLVKGASKGEGLGNQFLASIREVDAICQVVRCFEDENVTHVEGNINPLGDVETINMELALADLEIIDRRIGKLQKRVQVKEAEAVLEYGALSKIKNALDSNKDPRKENLSKQELEALKNYNFLTLKPTIYLANISDSDISDLNNAKIYQDFKKEMEKRGEIVIPVSILLENEIAHLSEEDQVIFLKEYGLERPTLREIILRTYDLLGLQTFFTVGEDEVRAWTFKKGMKAPECGGVIHSDFERGFIKAETINFEEFKKIGSAQKARELGKIRLEGKDYVVQDGDIMLFRFNV